MYPNNFNITLNVLRLIHFSTSQLYICLMMFMKCMKRRVILPKVKAKCRNLQFHEKLHIFREA